MIENLIFLENLQSEEGQLGLGFIASWIEIVIARLQLTVKDMSILVFSSSDSYQNRNRAPEKYSQLLFSGIRFYNSHCPEGYENTTSEKANYASNILSSKPSNDVSHLAYSRMVLNLTSKKVIK